MTSHTHRFEEIHKLASENTPIVLVGNKSDLVESRVITREQGVELAQSLGVEEYYFETSVKDNVNVSDTIEKLTELMYNNAVYQSS